MKSILSNERECYVCGAKSPLHRHHIFHGSANRRLSEEYGCWVYLCAHHHNASNHSVHYDHKMDIWLKAECQERWEALFGSTDDFISVFGRSYK